MRQAGIIAAAGLIAIDEAPKRLHEDHENARRLAEGLAQVAGVDIDLNKVVTNIVIFDISGTGRSSIDICAGLKERGVLAIGFGSSIRMVTHCDVSMNCIDGVLAALRTLF